jgi:glycosyltransferase involved in cell wall biosynthesis
MLRTRGFGSVDLLYIDSISQPFWLDAIKHRRAVYRLTDFSPNHAKFTPAAGRLEAETARRADLVLYPSQELNSYVTRLGARRGCCLPNGVEYQHFINPHPAPPEYAGLSGPVAVYVGKIVPWFHFAWVRQAARQLPGMTFVLIGQPELPRRELAGLDNVRILGLRDYTNLPAYMQHAQVGIIPFNAGREADTVDCLNPCKLYQYFAAGLPVVASDWPALRRLDSPVSVCRSADEFVAALQRATTEPSAAEHYRRFAARFEWQTQLVTILDELDRIDGEGTSDSGLSPQVEQFRVRVELEGWSRHGPAGSRLDAENAPVGKAISSGQLC